MAGRGARRECPRRIRAWCGARGGSVDYVPGDAESVRFRSPPVIARPPRAVVCDMDGLLVDSERLERRAWVAAAADHGIEMSDERFCAFVGHTWDECARMLTGFYGAALDVQAFRATAHRHRRAIMETDGVPLRSGAREWLEFVASAGLPLALATSSGPDIVRERLGELCAAFDAIVTRADVARGKPHPDMYLEAARRLRAAPGKCLAVEDSPIGARAAIAAGMPVVVVPDLVAAPADIAAAAVGVYESLHAVRDAAGRVWGVGLD